MVIKECRSDSDRLPPDEAKICNTKDYNPNDVSEDRMNLFYKWKPILVNISFLNCPHSEVPKAIKLDESMTLDKIREELSQCENGESIMKVDMYFCNNGGSNVIPRNQEAKTCLCEILSDNGNLCIWRSENPEEVISRLIEEKRNCPEYRCTFEKRNKNRYFKLCKNGIEWKLDSNMSW